MGFPIKRGIEIVGFPIKNGIENSGFSHEKWVDLSSSLCDSLPEGSSIATPTSSKKYLNVYHFHDIDIGKLVPPSSCVDLLEETLYNHQIVWLTGIFEH